MVTGTDTVDLPIESIDISKLNTRKNLEAGTEDASLDGLASSIKQKGLINAVQVRATSGDRFELISGQRRLMACIKLGLPTIRATIVELNDTDALTVSLVENVQRADMHPLDKAEAFQALQSAHGSSRAVAKQTGVTEATVRRYISLLRLPNELRSQVGTGNGPVGVGVMALLAQKFDDADEMRSAFDKVKGFTGSVAEQILRRSRGELVALDPLVDLAIAGEFDRVRCGSSLETCPYVPEAIRPTIAQLVASLTTGSPGSN